MKRIYFPTTAGDQCDSRFEAKMVQSLIDRGIAYEFHPEEREYSSSVRGGFCPECGSNSVRQGRLYTPDVKLLTTGVLVEIKGKFTPRNRNLMTQFIKAYSGTVAFCFMADNKLSPGSRTRYTGWAARLKCASAVKEIPDWWADPAYWTTLQQESDQ